VVLAQDGQLDAAIDHFRQALRIDPAHEQARDALGAALAQKGLAPEAIESFEENPLALVNIGNAHFRKGEWAEAKAHYLRALQIRPGDTGARNNLGLALLELGEWQEADRIFRRLIKERPDDPKLYYHLGLLQAGQGKDKEAIEAFDRAVELRPDYPEVYNQMGLILVRRGNRPGACHFFNLALQVQKDFSPAQKNKVSFCREP
jgi:tetratricopeptide (TPR) repeat protein